MSRSDHLPLGLGIAEILPIAVLTGGRNGINICLRNYHRAFVVCKMTAGANGTAEVFTLAQSSGAAGTAAGTGEKVLTHNVPFMYCNDCGLTEDGGQDVNWTVGTPAKAWTTDTAQSKSKICIFDIVPEDCLDLANNFDGITVNTTGSSSAHSGEVFAILLPRYKPPLTVTSDQAFDTGGSKSISLSASSSVSASASAS